MHNKLPLIILLSILSCLLGGKDGYLQAQEWPPMHNYNYPGTRWWWMGNAVDSANLKWNLNEYAKTGIKTVEVTPIYGVKGNESKEIPYLSPQWMNMWRYSKDLCQENGIEADMNMGTGWPFGGPEVTIDEAATKAFFQEYDISGNTILSISIKDSIQRPIAKLVKVMAYFPDNKVCDMTDRVKHNILRYNSSTNEKVHIIALFEGKSLQKVKRAAPGGEGLVMDHFSKGAVKNYLSKYEKAFTSPEDYPTVFFNDSYEVYDADWTAGLLDSFRIKRGYRLEDYFPYFLSKSDNDTTIRVKSDYRETLSELLLDNFTRQWTDWAHIHGSKIRNQAHGSPGNLIDIYAAVDIPECEGFGFTEFNIKGLRKDSMVRKNYSDLSMLKYASSAAHITGKPLTSSETFTWLTEHFRTSLSQCKPDLDLMFIAGVNHVMFHGTPYSPREARWPGWLFYASINMSPTNSIWRDASAFMEYIARCQSFLQWGKPDNDFLVYLPIYDMWNTSGDRYMAFDIHKMDHLAPEFIKTIQFIYRNGYDMDYISDAFISSLKYADGKLITSGGNEYKALIIPGVKLMQPSVLSHLIALAEQGATVIFTDRMPEDVPGLTNLSERRNEMRQTLTKLPVYKSLTNASKYTLGNGSIIMGALSSETLGLAEVASEEMKAQYGLSCIRRRNENGYHYFISNLQNKDIEAYIPLAIETDNVMIFNPMNGKKGKAQIRRSSNDKTEIFLQLPSGSSLILQTSDSPLQEVESWNYSRIDSNNYLPKNGWTLAFDEGSPEIKQHFDIDTIMPWTNLNDDSVRIFNGTATYTIEFNLSSVKADDWMIDLGDVRESARLKVNDQEVATLWAVPYKTEIGRWLRKGRNKIEIEVTNLPANRIADYDRKGTEWRIFKDINIVNLEYKPDSYADWKLMPSGLNSGVSLYPVHYLKLTE